MRVSLPRPLDLIKKEEVTELMNYHPKHPVEIQEIRCFGFRYSHKRGKIFSEKQKELYT